MNTNKQQPFLFYSTNGNQLSTDPFIYVFETRDPTVSDINYPIQKLWINTTTEKLFCLTNFTSSTGTIQANWIEISSSTADINTLTGNDSVPVSPVANNIGVVGSATGALEFTSGGAGILEGAVKYDGTTIGINGSNELTTLASGLEWILIDDNITAEVNKAYVTDIVGPNPIEITLPATCALGDTIKIVATGRSAKVIPDATQIIRAGNEGTTPATGFILLNTANPVVEISCITPNLVWLATNGWGNFEIDTGDITNPINNRSDFLITDAITIQGDEITTPFGADIKFTPQGLGVVLMPNQPAFSAYLAASVNNVTGNGTTYTIAGWTQITDQDANFDPVTGVFTALKDGSYIFNASVSVDDLTVLMTRMIVNLEDDAGLVTRLSQCNPYAIADDQGIACISGSAIIYMNQNDTMKLTVQISNGAGDTATVVGGADYVTYFSGWMLG